MSLLHQIAAWMELHCLGLSAGMCLAGVASLLFGLLLLSLLLSPLSVRAQLVFSSDDDDPLVLLSLTVRYLLLRVTVRMALGQPQDMRVKLAGWTLWRYRKKDQTQKKSASRPKSTRPGFVLRQMKKISINWQALWPWLWRRVAEIDLHELRGELAFGCADPACTGQVDAFLWSLRGVLPGDFFQHRALYGGKVLRADLHIALRVKALLWFVRAMLCLPRLLRWQRGTASKQPAFIV